MSILALPPDIIRILAKHFVVLRCRFLRTREEEEAHKKAVEQRKALHACDLLLLSKHWCEIMLLLNNNNNINIVPVDAKRIETVGGDGQNEN